MKLLRFHLFLLILVLVPAAFDLQAREFKLPKFLPGDVVSSDVFNSILGQIEDANKEFAAEDLFGTWSCDAFAELDMERANKGWQAGENDIYMTLSATLTFSGDYKLRASTPTPFLIKGSDFPPTKFTVQRGYLMFSMEFVGMWASEVIKISRTSIKLVPLTAGGDVSILFCQKQDLPPLGPSNLSLSASGRTVTLTWTDNSSDESGYSIRRKDTVDGDYLEIDMTAANMTSYTDIVPSSGTYWYRIFATNENGDSIGSNVIKVEIK